MYALAESHILLFLVQVFILLLCARGLGELFRRWKQPAVTAELLVGILLGPTLLGRFFPGVYGALFPNDVIQQCMLETIAWLGVLFLLLDTGLEIDFSIAWRQRGSALTIALFDIFIPMLVAFGTVVFLPEQFLVNPNQRILFALFMATVMTISAMPVAVRCLHDLNLLKTDLGFLTMSALAVNDIIGWVLFAIILALFTQTTVAFDSILLVFIGTLGFSALVLTAGRRFSIRVFNAMKARHFPEPGSSLTVTVLLGLLLGAVTQKLGVHALFGFFLAGIVAGEAKSLSEDTRRVISQMVYSLFVPLFFANIGLKIDFIENFHFGLVALICLVGIGGRYLGAWFGVTCAKVPRVNRDLISIAHTPGGMMEIVVAMLALEAHLITSPVFVAIVFSAIFSSIVMGPWLSRAMAQRRKVSPATFLEKALVYPAIPGEERNDVLRQMARDIADSVSAMDAQEISRMVISREEEFGTALGHGIAIPHVRLEKLRKPVLAFARSTEGIEWNAPDAAPVHFIFFLVSATGAEDIHVQTLAYISRAMAKEENRERLADAVGQNKLFDALEKILTEPASARPAPLTPSAAG
ncbi:MAG: cation:proton antiporter [Verrucomicrobiota bacterium]|jgi:Kef-type K+ transport system membrane component KefB/mannitol/fructose-specific phosphotransferase system IIA component (Ntr-type)|nr:cation:proton antiporter [Verrucomicrobiota bacterium]